MTDTYVVYVGKSLGFHTQPLSLSPGREDFGAADGAAQVAHGAVTGVASLFPLHMESVQGYQDSWETHEKPDYPLPARGGHSQDGRRHFFPA